MAANPADLDAMVEAYLACNGLDPLFCKALADWYDDNDQPEQAAQVRAARFVFVHATRTPGSLRTLEVCGDEVWL